MMLLIWPMIFALILGLIIGSQIKLKNGDTHFTLGSFIVILFKTFPEAGLLFTSSINSCSFKLSGAVLPVEKLL